MGTRINRPFFRIIVLNILIEIRGKMENDKWFITFDEHLMHDKIPSEYFNDLVKDRRFPKMYPFTLLTDLIDVPQSPVHHPEGNVWNHTMLVVDNAADEKRLSKNPRVLMWAALLHDLGKISTTKERKGRITAYDHDKVGEKVARRFLEACVQDEAFIKQVSLLVRWHMQVLFVLKNLPFSNLEQMVREADPSEIALLSLCDRLGRGNNTEENVQKEKKNMLIFLEKCQQIIVKTN